MSDTAQRNRAVYSYTEEQRQEALDIFVEHGRKVAEERTGIKGATIANWASSAGLTTVTDANRLAQIEAKNHEFERKFSNLKVMILDEATAALEDMRKPFTKTIIDQKGGEHQVTEPPDPSERARLSTSFGILFDKLQISTGGTTANIQLKAPDLKALVEQNAKNEATKAAIITAINVEITEA